MKTVLIVDDIFENLYLLRVILEGAGYVVIEAEHGKEGLEKLNKNKIDLIISDILMPVMDGYMFCQECKKDASYKDIPFVFYTSTYIEKPDEDFAIKLGAAKFLRKPTDPSDILLIVDRILSTEKSKEKITNISNVSKEEVLNLYSARLISKLEQKNLDLEKEVIERKKAEKLLVDKNEVLAMFSVNTPLNEIFDQLLLNYEYIHPDYFGAISLVSHDGKYLNLKSAPSLPKDYNLECEILEIANNQGSCPTAAFTKKTVIVSDISTNKLWVKYRNSTLKYGLKSCWSIPILSKNKRVLGTFALYSKSINTPSKSEIEELNFAVNLAKIAIERSIIIEEIKKKDESYKALIDQASDSIVTYTLDGTMYNFNRAAYKNLGYTEKEFVKLKIQDINIGDIIVNQDNLEKLRNGQAIISNRKFKRKDKSLRDVEISSKLREDGRIVAIARDITERKKAELDLKMANEFSSNLLKSMHEGLYAISLDSTIISVNPSFCKMTGFKENELIGVKRPYPFSPPELRDANDERYKLLIQNKNKRDYENIYMRKNGDRFHVQVYISSVFDENGNKRANFATVQDITQRKKAEIDLILAKEFNDKLVMSMQEGLLMLDITGEIIKVNESLCKILGYSEQELIGLDLPYPFVKPEDLIRIQDIVKRVANGEAPSFQFEFSRKNGTQFIASFLTGNIKDDNGHVIAIFATVKDISEEEKAKKILEDIAAKSQQKKKVILELANLVGQDFNRSLDKITELAAQTLNIGRVSVWKFNHDHTVLFCQKLYELESETHSIAKKLKACDHPKYFKALQLNETLIVNDAHNDEITRDSFNDYLMPFKVRSLMDVFINSTSGYYGILSFEQVVTSRVWTHDEQEFATSMASIVSLMVESTERKLAEDELVIKNQELNNSLTEIIELKSQLEQENIYLRDELDLVFNYEEMVYGSLEFSNVLTEIEKVAPTDATVLLLGESGTGKELLARAIHNISNRNQKPLIKVNCSAIPRELLESELFGHKKGSFTGAFSDKIGKFELAHNGTLFLDEIGELPIDMQPKILRFLQEGEIEVVGGTSSKHLNVRVIAATNRNLKEAIEKKEFREDLYFRLNVFPVMVPPLNKRKDDIPILVEHFVHKFNKAYGKNIQYIADDAMHKLKSYDWPGNIRELENLIERAAILSTDETLLIPGFESSKQKTKSINNKDLSLDTIQRNHIFQVLEQCNWKISGENSASTLLKLKPSTLRDRMHKLGLKKPS
ncbi:sigma 54-interacting transcriptional regulator [Psychroserpens damuponensis]|uniref:sigma 54-interacting transcriptional regulator n=1 Tax=Psychroserpens damuponensis TaxID=943936 RepID=UPI000693CE75|nr:sigma 54-interacting transcriptional regulator [Psychroserpens damuponensis]